MNKKRFLLAGTLQFCNQATNLLLTVLLARHLGADPFGVFVFGISFLGYINLFSDLGITTQGVKDLSRKNFSFQDLLEKIVSTKVILSTALFIFATFYIGYFQEGSNQEKLSIIFIIFISVVNCFNMGWYFNTNGSYLWYFLPKNASTCILIIYVFYFEASLYLFCLLFTVSEIMISFSHLWKVKKTEKISLLSKRFLTFNFDYLKQSLDTSAVLILDFLLTYLVIIIPGFFGNYTEVTTLFIINKLFYVFLFPLKNLISLTFIPTLSLRQNEFLGSGFAILVIKFLLISFSFSMIYVFFIITYIKPITFFIFAEEISTDYIVILLAMNFIMVCISLPLWLFRVAFQKNSQKGNNNGYKLLPLACFFTLSMFCGYTFGGVGLFLGINFFATSLWVIYLAISLRNLNKRHYNAATDTSAQ